MTPTSFDFFPALLSSVRFRLMVGMPIGE